jgi:CRP-like cAMP-binding protein
MKSASLQIRRNEYVRPGPAGGWNGDAAHRGAGRQARAKGDVTMEPEARSGRMEAVQAHPLAELLACPPATGNLLNDSSQCIDFEAGETVFCQNATCCGLYILVSGQFLRKTERLQMRLTLSPARAGDLVELAAALGDGLHTYTLKAQTPGSVLLLPMKALNQAFQEYPLLRMHLLEELAREVSRAYNVCRLNHLVKARQRSPGAEEV